MLVTRRRTNEAVLIGDDIEIKVLEISSSWVKLGIRAPRSIPVVRCEVMVTRERNTEAARTATPATLSEIARLLRESRAISAPDTISA